MFNAVVVFFVPTGESLVAEKEQEKYPEHHDRKTVVAPKPFMKGGAPGRSFPDHAQERPQFVKVERLRQIMIEPGFLSELEIFLRPARR